MKTARISAILILIFLFAVALPCMAMAAAIGKITAIEGDVDVLKPGMERAAPAALQQPVSEGDIVRTKSNAKAEITFADDSVIRLAPGSRLQITEYLLEGNKRKSGVMNLFRGKVRAVVSKSRGFLGVAFGAGDRFEVRTPTAVAGVKGTDFFVSYNMGVTGIVVTDGKVDVFNPAIPGQIVPVSAGNATFISENKPPSAPRPATDVEVIRHIKDTDTGEKPKEKNDETSTITASAGGPPAGGTFGYEAPGGTPPPAAGAGGAVETVVIPSSETHPELLSDITPPVIGIAGPPAFTNQSTANFTVTTNETANITYAMDGWGATSPNTTADNFSIAGLAEGTHVLTVTAIDAAGNKSTQTYPFTTDYTPPTSLTLSGTPASVTNINNATIGATATDANTITYKYTLDGIASTGNLTGLSEGAHTFIATATDAAGNTSTKTYSWTTDYTAPVVSITSKAASPQTPGVDLTAVNISFSNNDPAAIYSYTFDIGAATATTGSISLNGLAEGNHTLAINATDAAGNTSSNVLSFDLSRYSLSGNLWGDGGMGGVGTTTGEVAGVSNQTWGRWNMSMSGNSGALVPSPSWILYTGGTSSDATYIDGRNNGYWYLTAPITTNFILQTLSGASSFRYLSQDRLGIGTGNLTGAYDGLGNYSLTDTGAGTYTETPLAWSGKIIPDNNGSFSYTGTGAGLYSMDTWGWLDIEGNSVGIMGGIASPWVGPSTVNYMGKYDVSLGIGVGPPYLWTPEINSYNPNNLTNTTFDGGAYRGFVGGVWNADSTINAKVYSLYIDPSGNAGILKGSLVGAYYAATTNMFSADGTWTPTTLTTGLNPATATYNVVSTNYGYSITSLGDFSGSGSITVAGDEMLAATDWRYSISGQDWGVWKSIIGGDYTGPTSDTWSLSTTVNLGQTIYGTKTDGTKWSTDVNGNNVLTGQTYGYGADISTTPQTWITVGETIGTFDPLNSVWQAVQTSAWLDTNKFLAMTQTAQGQAALTALNIPFAEVGRANLTDQGTGTIGGTPATANMNNVIFFAYQTGAAPKIWATGDIQGTYTCSACGGGTIPVAGNGLSANLNVQTFDTAGQKWIATVNGSGTYSGTGTMNGTNVQMTGAAAGTNSGGIGGTFSGTAAGTAK